MERCERQTGPAGTVNIETDALVIGAGPVGLFQVFELGLLGIGAHVVDALPYAGGQCIELYPDKPIYDIPGTLATTGRQLVASLLEQIKPFKTTFHLNQQVNTLARQADGRFLVQTSANKTFLSKTVVIAAGVGAFQPKKLTLAGLDAFTGTQLFYHLDAQTGFAGQKVVVVGSEDTAVDAAIELANEPSTRVTLLHRRDVFNAAPDKLATMRRFIAAGKLQLRIGQVAGLEERSGQLTTLQVTDVDGQTAPLPVDTLLVLQGLSPKLGPVSNWGLALERKQLSVDTEKFQTSEAGIFAVGDINTYPGKKKLILCGFHECALASFAAAEIVFPDVVAQLQYTTTSTLLHQRLGVAHP
ncbi:MAG: NAD(P)/FAD-dependent oxidoreductase [Burkholderiaceae bacterium]|nr:NAD(P)/FAD-dependent oxidoreductase [Burkholderiaceae bacterium]